MCTPQLTCGVTKRHINSEQAGRLTPANSTNAAQNGVVDGLILVDNVDGQDDTDAKRGELFTDSSRRQLTEAVHMRRRHYDRCRPLHKQ